MEPLRHRLQLDGSRFGLLWLCLVASLFVLPAVASAQEEDQSIPLPQSRPAQSAPDTVLPQIAAAIEGLTSADVAALRKALHIGDSDASGCAPNTLAAIGDMDGDGVPELLLKWALPDSAASAEVAAAPDSQALWGVYLLSWDGSHWKASRLLTAVEDFSPIMVQLGPPVGTAIAAIIHQGPSGAAYPAMFQLHDHTATLLWDAQADDSRYQALLDGDVRFENNAHAPAEMIVTGRADPGLLQVERGGHRGFQVRAVYHWDGKAFVPAKIEYSANQDYTVYRFISALHLHDYRSAYKLIVPADFLRSEAPTVDAFRHFIEENWPEFLEDAVFEAPEVPAGSPDEHAFVLPKPERRDVYHPVFSSDGKFLLTGLTRTHEATEP